MRKVLRAFGGTSWKADAVDAWLDGEQPLGAADEEAAREAIATDPALAAYAKGTNTLREGVALLKDAAPAGIADTQMPAYLDALRDKVQADRPAFGGWGQRVMVSTATAVVAAIAVAFGLFVVISGGHTSVDARTEVQEYSTELPGARIEVSENVLFISGVGGR